MKASTRGLASLAVAAVLFASAACGEDDDPLSGNELPQASAGPDQTLSDNDSSGSESVTLDGTASTDQDGSITSYRWTEAATEIGTGETPTVILTVGTHTVTLTVTDDDGATDTDQVVITVIGQGGNQPPTADAGPDQTVADSDGSGDELVTLDGVGSSDLDGSIVAYAWTEGSTIVGTGPSPLVTFTVGTHALTLTVTDDQGATDADQVTITVNSVAPSSVSYSADIQPYFDARCTSCHSGGGPKGVDLDSYANLLAGGNSGPLVVPGNSNQGTLIPQLESGHQGAPHGTNVIQDIRDWVDAGALDN